MGKNLKTAAMPIITPSMAGHGPLVYTRFQSIDRNVSSLTCLALLDTGASNSVIDMDYISQCQVASRGTGKSFTPHGDKISQYFSLDVSMCGIAGEFIPEFKDVVVGTENLSAFAYKFIVGRDILSKCTFIFDGRNGKYSLEWE